MEIPSDEQLLAALKANPQLMTSLCQSHQESSHNHQESLQDDQESLQDNSIHTQIPVNPPGSNKLFSQKNFNDLIGQLSIEDLNEIKDCQSVHNIRQKTKVNLNNAMVSLLLQLDR